MEFMWIAALAITSVVTGAIASGTNDAAKFCFVLFFPSVFLLYLSPSIVASQRGRPNIRQIVILNLFFGWTLIGWVGALIWAYSTNGGPAPAPQQAPRIDEGTKQCPYCAETIRSAAIKCRYCGSDLQARGPLTATMDPGAKLATDEA